MTDIVDSKTRSKMMSRVKSKNTSIEIAVRKALFAKGFRYKINDKNLPGKPDIVLPKYKAVIFVNGCFWHGHNCSKGHLPKSNISFWKQKIENNKKRDLKNMNLLNKSNWKVAIIWECTIKEKRGITLDYITDMLTHWLQSKMTNLEIPPSN